MSPRASFLFPKDAATQLAAIRERTYIENDADIIRLALSVYDTLLELADSNQKIAIQDKSGHEWPYSPHLRFSYPGLEQFPDPEAPAGEGQEAKNFFFSGDAVQHLASIRDRSGVRTNADAIRIALTALNHFLKIDAAGDSVVIHDLDGQKRLFNVLSPASRRQVSRRAHALSEPTA
jgi:hypothetical protein